MPRVCGCEARPVAVRNALVGGFASEKVTAPSCVGCAAARKMMGLTRNVMLVKDSKYSSIFVTTTCRQQNNNTIIVDTVL